MTMHVRVFMTVIMTAITCRVVGRAEVGCADEGDEVAHAGVIVAVEEHGVEPQRRRCNT